MAIISSVSTLRQIVLDDFPSAYECFPFYAVKRRAAATGLFRSSVRIRAQHVAFLTSANHTQRLTAENTKLVWVHA